VSDAGRGLAQEVMLAPRDRGLGERQSDERRGRAGERRRVDQCDDVPAERGEEPRRP
jgi:hypothetical protein